MIWGRDPLWTKARLFLELAFEQPADDPRFGLWCSFGLEILARAAIASVSPTLLAEPHREHQNLLYALGVGPALPTPQSISASQVFAQCNGLFANFSQEDRTASMALINRRNAELHSAEAAFENYPSRQWLPGFYRSCTSLVNALGETLESLLGPEQARAASEILRQSKDDVQGKVKASIAAHKRVFEDKTPADRQAAANTARDRVAKLVNDRHHKVACPACQSDATIEGDAFGRERIDHDENGIVVRQSISPRIFNCSACGLKLSGYAELDAANLAGIYTRRTILSPEDYYGLINPESADMSEYIERYLQDIQEYDNE